MSIKKIWVKKAAGRRVDDPETGKTIGDDPVQVRESSFWRRCIRDGDVLETKQPSTAAPVPQSEPAAITPSTKKK